MYSFNQIALLITCTAGTVLYLFLLTLFAGLRRRKRFEVILFLTGIAVFLVYSAKLLEVNAAIYYEPGRFRPISTMIFGGAIAALGGSLLPPLLVHAHFEYWRWSGGDRTPRWFYPVVRLFYLPAVILLVLWATVLLEYSSISRETLRFFERWLFGPWFVSAFFLSAAMELHFARRESRQSFSRLHVTIAAAFLVVLATRFIPHTPGWIFYLVLLVPGALLGYQILRNRFLPLGVQRNVVITVTVGFLALLYLTLVQRISEWLEPDFPPIATRSIFIFVLVLFFDPLQRTVGKALGRAFRREAEKLQRLTAEIQQVARGGDLDEVVRFAETRIAETLGLPGVRIVLRGGPDRPAAVSGPAERFALREGAEEIGTLEARYYGQTLSGETHAALAYLAEQLPAALDLCRLIEAKLKLERELAERERLALLGQMAARISHNLKNPLGSMKTLLQVQLENPNLPEGVRRDCSRVVEEIDRLGAKLAQLLQYAKPPIRAAQVTEGVAVAAVTEQVVSLLRHEAERRGVKLEFEADAASRATRVQGSEEALHDLLSNLVVNGLEAVSSGGAVRVALAREGGALLVTVADDGPGIPAEARERIFQPFFTTKPSGTGLGLAIVERRVEELGGTVTWKSPVQNARGTEFTVTLPILSAGGPAEEAT